LERTGQIKRHYAEYGFSVYDSSAFPQIKARINLINYIHKLSDLIHIIEFNIYLLHNLVSSLIIIDD